MKNLIINILGVVIACLPVAFIVLVVQGLRSFGDPSNAKVSINFLLGLLTTILVFTFIWMQTGKYKQLTTAYKLFSSVGISIVGIAALTVLATVL